MSTIVSLGIRLVAIMLIAAVGSPSVAAQQAATSTDPEVRAFESRFWTYLIANNYKNWAPPAGSGDQFQQGQSPHGPLQKLYLNRTAAANDTTLPDESVIVLENYRADKSLKSIAVMVRSTGTDAANKDWFMVLYGPDGSVLESSGRDQSQSDVQSKTLTSTLAASNQTCVQCHQSAPGHDLVFFNRSMSRRAAGESILQSTR
jgi:hypothetical protein